MTTELLTQEELSELEGKLVPFEQWKTCGAPDHLVMIALLEHEQQVPTGIARHERLGWCVIQTSGQGPYLIVHEREKDQEGM